MQPSIPTKRKMAKYFTRLNKDYSGLTFDFQVDPDSCGNSTHYEQYLSFHASSDRIVGKGVTHILIDDSEKKAIIGFVTLRASSLISEFNGNIQGRSALEITELAVDKRHLKKGYGTDLVKFAIAMADELRCDSIAIEYVVACSDPLAIPFYEKNGFVKISDYNEVPREQWNNNCIPMILKLPEIMPV